MEPDGEDRDARCARVRAAWPLPDAHRVRDAVIEAYDEPHRHYHDVRHLDEVLLRVGEICGAEAALDVEQEAVLLAAFLHDVVYETPATGDPARNEERSAAYARHALEGITGSHVVAEVERLVRGTATHAAVTGDTNGAVLFDADLAIFAADRQRYAEYLHDVRLEYAAVGDTEFARGRAVILRALLAQPSLFATDYGRERWEATARANVTRELARSVG